MKYIIAFIAFLSFPILHMQAQDSFNYSLEFNPISIPALPGLQSFAFAQHEGKWLFIGGRKDGLHARQPFSAFPATENNSNIYVVDVNKKQFWTASVNSLATGLKEQLQSTNMNFCQANDTLYIIGGYAFSATANDHITFPYLTTIQVSGLMNAIIAGNAINSFFKQTEDQKFAVTGGQLGIINNVFYLVGGQKFSGRYNPMGNPTFTQTYTNEIRKFKISNQAAQIQVSNYSVVHDEIHLHRRDYNLVPQIFPDRSEGYTISSGVFQINADLPFLYPVDIKENGYVPQTSFNQYLSNYHSAKISLYDSLTNAMHSLFLGGMSQYYYKDGGLIKDDLVPFVKTISRVTRDSAGTLKEYQLLNEMPALLGAGAEFILNKSIPHTESEIIKLSKIEGESLVIGHMFGGIQSSSLNPFSNNQTNLTSANNIIYEVKLVNKTPTSQQLIEGENPYKFEMYPNPAGNWITIKYHLEKRSDVCYFISDQTGKIMQKGNWGTKNQGNHSNKLQIDTSVKSQILIVTLVIDNIYFVSNKLVKK